MAATTPFALRLGVYQPDQKGQILAAKPRCQEKNMKADGTIALTLAHFIIHFPCRVLIAYKCFHKEMPLNASRVTSRSTQARL
jgi:hypothetical protein